MIKTRFKYVICALHLAFHRKERKQHGVSECWAVMKVCFVVWLVTMICFCCLARAKRAPEKEKGFVYNVKVEETGGVNWKAPPGLIIEFKKNRIESKLPFECVFKPLFKLNKKYLKKILAQ